MNDYELQSALLMLHDGFIFPAYSPAAPMCVECRRPIEASFYNCYRCKCVTKDFPSFPNNEHGFMFYAIEGQQSHWLMRQYKGQRSHSPLQHTAAFNTLHNYLYLALKRHLKCIERKGCPAFDAWTVVPSIDEQGSHSSLTHPLYQLVSGVLSRCGFDLQHVEIVSQPTPNLERRAVSPNHFTIASCPEAPKHVLVIDDTWVSGGHLVSAAISVEKTLRTRVSTLAIARYITQSDDTSKALVQRIQQRHLASYWPVENCIWTLDGNCPSQ